MKRILCWILGHDFHPWWIFPAPPAADPQIMGYYCTRCSAVGKSRE